MTKFRLQDTAKRWLSGNGQSNGAGPNRRAKEERLPPSIISSALTVVGNINGAGDLRIDGVVEGDVTGGSLKVGQGAKVKGALTADEVIVQGTVEGTIKARRVEIASTADVSGEIWHEVLAIAAGALVDGHCKRMTPARPPEINQDVAPPASLESPAGGKPQLVRAAGHPLDSSRVRSGSDPISSS